MMGKGGGLVPYGSKGPAQPRSQGPGARQQALTPLRFLAAKWPQPSSMGQVNEMKSGT